MTKFSEDANIDHTHLVCEFQLSPLLGSLVVSEQSRRSRPRAPEPTHPRASLALPRKDRDKNKSEGNTYRNICPICMKFGGYLEGLEKLLHAKNQLSPPLRTPVTSPRPPRGFTASPSRVEKERVEKSPLKISGEGKTARWSAIEETGSCKKGMVVPRTKSNIMIPIIIRYCEWTASFSAVVVKKS